MSKSISEKMDNVVKESMLEQFLGSENMEDLKKKIANVIVNQIKDDLAKTVTIYYLLTT